MLIATRAKNATIHYFKVVAGLAGGHEVLPREEFETRIDAIPGEPVVTLRLDGRGFELGFGPDESGGYSNILVYHDDGRDECQLCRIRNEGPYVGATDVPRKR